MSDTLLGKGNIVINRLDNFFLPFRSLYPNGKIDNIQINIYYVRYSFVHTSTVEGIRDLWEKDIGIVLDSLRKIEGKRRRR